MKYKGIKKLYYSISEISDMLGIKQSVIRYWESEFKELKPQKNRAGNRVYKKEDIAILRMIHHYVHEKHLSIHEANEVIQDLKKEGLFKRKLTELNKTTPRPVSEKDDDNDHTPAEKSDSENEEADALSDEAMENEEHSAKASQPDFEIVIPTEETFIYPLDEDEDADSEDAEETGGEEEEEEIVSSVAADEESESQPEPPREEKAEEKADVKTDTSSGQSDREMKELLNKISRNIRDIIDILNE